jgi:hypothetical protein
VCGALGVALLEAALEAFGTGPVRRAFDYGDGDLSVPDRVQVQPLAAGRGR